MKISGYSIAGISVALVLATSCSGQQADALVTTASLKLKETSGLEYTPNGKLWALEDSGNSNKLYELGADGNVAHTVTLIDARNNDWEDLTSDAEGNLYIGDFGNNDNDRRNLAIYKVPAEGLNLEAVKAAQVTEFYYPEQKEFPPKKSDLMYDCEAFYLSGDSFYLFTKNRSKMFDGTFYVYRVPNQPGRHMAKQIGTLKSCDNYRKCAITGADISPDGSRVALISGANAWIITGFTTDDFSKASLQNVPFGEITQKEGITFKDDSTLLIADEKEKKTGGKLYTLSLNSKADR